MQHGLHNIKREKRMPFVLELQEYQQEKKTYKHCGYLKVVFCTRDDASDYLEKHKPDVVKLSSTNGWKSVEKEKATGGKAKMRYVAREHYGEKCEIESL